MKSPAERGVIGAWAYEARGEADLSVPQVVRALETKGYAVTDATIRGIESGVKKPGRRLLRMLGEVYGSRPPGEEEPASEEPDLAAAIREQTIAQRDATAAQREATVAINRLVGLVAELLSRQATEAAPGSAARLGDLAAAAIADALELRVPAEQEDPPIATDTPAPRHGRSA